MQGNPEPKPMNEISETLTNVTAPPTNGNSDSTKQELYETRKANGLK